MGGAEERVREMGRQGRAEEDEEDREERCAEGERKEEREGGWLDDRIQTQTYMGELIEHLHTTSLLLSPLSVFEAAGCFRCPCFGDFVGVGCFAAPLVAGRHVTA